jgi:hypothetical protein
VITVALANPNVVLGNGDTTGFRATATLGGAPLAGRPVNFTTANAGLLTVSPATATTNGAGVANATLTGQTSSRSSTLAKATLAGTSAAQSRTVQVPDLSAIGFVIMIAGIAFVGWRRRRSV